MEMYLTISLSTSREIFMVLGTVLFVLAIIIDKKVLDHIDPIKSIPDGEYIFVIIGAIFLGVLTFIITIFAPDTWFLYNRFILLYSGIFLVWIAHLGNLYRLIHTRITDLLFSYQNFVFLSGEQPVMYRKYFAGEYNFNLDYWEIMFHVFRNIPEVIFGEICWTIPIHSPQNFLLFRIGVKVDPEYITKNRLLKKEWNESYFQTRIGYQVDALLQEFIKEFQEEGHEPLLSITVSLTVSEIADATIFVQNEALLQKYSGYLQKHLVERLSYMTHANFVIFQVGEEQ